MIYYDQLGFIQGRSGSRLEFAVPRNSFRTADGQWVLIAGSNQSIFENICEGLGREDLVADPRFADNRERMKNPDALEDELQKTVATLTLDEVMGRLTACDGAATPINDVRMVVENEQVRARGNIARLEDAELGGPVRMQEVFGRLSRTPGKIRHAGEPLGSSNREILVERLGYAEERLRSAGIDPD